MQHQGDRPVRAGRPSLLSPDEQAAPERQGILRSLDGMPAQTRAVQGPRPRSRALAWGFAAVGAIVAGGALFLLGANDAQRAPAVAAAAAPSVATVADVPRAAPDAPMANPLAEMAVPAPERHKAYGAKAEKAEKAERREAHAKAAHRKAHDTAPEKRTKPRAAREQDSDVVLLAALMSHMEPANRKATPAQQLESCRRYNAAGEEQCRVRVCERGGRKEAACKRVPAGGTDSAS